jgi:flagellin
VEVSQLIDEVDRVASQAQFNKLNMLTGRFANPAVGGIPTASIWFHIGANRDQRVQSFVGTMTAFALGLVNSSNEKQTVSTIAMSNRLIGVVDQALDKVAKQRADLGAYQNRLEFTARGLMIGYENLQASESRIRDTDMAEEMVAFTRSRILLETGTSMLAQANIVPQTVLKLLG